MFEKKSKRQENTNNSDLEQDNERVSIRNELSSLSFEDLQKLKEKIGAKVYKEVVFGKKQAGSHEAFKRENKNRPREMSSKKPVPMLQNTPVHVKKQEIRDPRFDPLCGTFDKKEFAENYNFLASVRINDIRAIKRELKQTTDPEKEQSLRRLIQRLNEQQKAIKTQKLEREKRHMQKNEVEAEFREGKQPYFKHKSEVRVESLVKQYEELKKQGTGRLQRHLKRRQQKIKKRSFKTPVNANE
ncbi:ribosomal RNA processing protein 36 homolog [Maniola hyperantus]|uniref:ribosomal RNA processing protein 36 homolog n=1 Tax=Aphantopus hyperantus TaxID=2795564 RepID=UPI001569F16B|nr:ribosomal RNA processing protein 36 homolog [Maniola hyperantus]